VHLYLASVLLISKESSKVQLLLSTGNPRFREPALLRGSAEERSFVKMRNTVHF
jgi:hypothetical protein